MHLPVQPVPQPASPSLASGQGPLPSAFWVQPPGGHPQRLSPDSRQPASSTGTARRPTHRHAGTNEQTHEHIHPVSRGSRTPRQVLPCTPHSHSQVCTVHSGHIHAPGYGCNPMPAVPLRDTISHPQGQSQHVGNPQRPIVEARPAATKPSPLAGSPEAAAQTQDCQGHPGPSSHPRNLEWGGKVLTAWVTRGHREPGRDKGRGRMAFGHSAGPRSLPEASGTFQ